MVKLKKHFWRFLWLVIVPVVVVSVVVVVVVVAVVSMSSVAVLELVCDALSRGISVMPESLH